MVDPVDRHRRLAVVADIRRDVVRVATTRLIEERGGEVPELLVLIAQVGDGEVARDRRLLAEVPLTLVVYISEEDPPDIG